MKKTSSFKRYRLSGVYCQIVLSIPRIKLSPLKTLFLVNIASSKAKEVGRIHKIFSSWYSKQPVTCERAGHITEFIHTSPDFLKSNQEKSTKKATAEEGKLSLLVISHLSSSPSEYAKGLQEVYHRVRDCVVVQ